MIGGLSSMGAHPTQSRGLLDDISSQVRDFMGGGGYQPESSPQEPYEVRAMRQAGVGPEMFEEHDEELIEHQEEETGYEAAVHYVTPSWDEEIEGALTQSADHVIGPLSDEFDPRYQMTEGF